MSSTTGTTAKRLAWFWALGLVLGPLSYVLAISFLTRGEYGGIQTPWTLENYRQIFSAETGVILSSSFFRSLQTALLNTALCIFVGYPLSLFLSFRASRFKNLLFFMLIVPFWTNFLIRTYAWFAILSDNGWLNTVLARFGIGGWNVLFTPAAILIGMFYNYLPFMAMSLFVSVEKIDPMLLDAAADLGAGPLKRFFKIILPLSAPGLLAGSIMVFIPSLGEFVIPDILGGGTNLYLGNMLAQQFLVVRNWPFGAALSVILVVAIFGAMKWLEKATNGKLQEELLS